MKRIHFITFFAAIALCALAHAADVPKYSEGDFVMRDFRFASGEVLPELRIHYRTFGRIARDANGHATNVVLIGHGTGGSGASLTDPPNGAALFAGELFGKGQPLDAEKYFVVVHDGLGHGNADGHQITNPFLQRIHTFLLVCAAHDPVIMSGVPSKKPGVVSYSLSGVSQCFHCHAICRC